MFIHQAHPKVVNVLFGAIFCLMAPLLPAANSDMPRVEPLENLVMGYQFGSPLPFVAEIAGESKVYRWPTLAIHVISVECDGKKLLPFGNGIAINSFDDATMAVCAGHITYLALASTLISVREYRETTGEYEADGYTIPPQFKQLVITYRCRFPGGESKRVYKLRIAE